MIDERFRNFAAVKIVELEGGYVNSKSDIGGETNFGISSKFNPNVDVKNLSRGQAVAFYVGHPYYMKDCEDIICPGFRFIYVDVRVSGQRACVVVLQNMVNSFLPEELRMKADGLWGKQTTRAVNALSDGLRVPVLQALLALSSGIGSTQARITMDAQKRAGAQVYDYTAGFIKRARERAEIALVLAKNQSLK